MRDQACVGPFRNWLQISFLILNEFKQIDGFRGNRS